MSGQAASGPVEGYVLPRKYLSAGALLFAGERVLLVNPTYKPQWEIPGGIVEDGESPRDACIRELREELGIHIVPERLLGLDYRNNPRFGEGLHFIFHGGELTPERLDAIRLPAAELSECRLATLEEASTLLVDSVARRVAVCAAAAREGRTVYMDDGVPLG